MSEDKRQVDHFVLIVFTTVAISIAGIFATSAIMKHSGPVKTEASRTLTWGDGKPSSSPKSVAREKPGFEGTVGSAGAENADGEAGNPQASSEENGGTGVSGRVGSAESGETPVSSGAESRAPGSEGSDLPAPPPEASGADAKPAPSVPKDVDRKLPASSVTVTVASAPTSTGSGQPAEQRAFEAAVLARDPGLCASIKDPGTKTSCLDSTSYTYAIRIRDPSACDKISVPQAAEDCRKAVKAVAESDKATP